MLGVLAISIWQKMGVDEEIFVVDLKKGAVSTGPSLPLTIRVVRVSVFVRVSEKLSSSGIGV
jgi:hypothetical protein